MSGNYPDSSSPFETILVDDVLCEIIVKDDQKQFALITSMEPEAAIHWLAIPYESGQTTAELQANNPERFQELIEWTIANTRERLAQYPAFANGFTIKLHFGAYETVPHAKLHVLSVE